VLSYALAPCEMAPSLSFFLLPVCTVAQIIRQHRNSGSLFCIQHLLYGLGYLNINANVAIALGSFPASSDTVKAECMVADIQLG
jgi:hypothetical protein